MIASIINAANCRAVFKYAPACKIKNPRPSSDATNSAIIAPTKERVIETFMALKK